MTFLISAFIRTTFELFDFIKKDNNIYSINISVESIVNSIVSTQSRSQSLAVFSRSRWINTSYSFEWIVNRSRFRQNVRRFVVNIEIYRNSRLYFDWLNVNVTSIISRSLIFVQVISVEDSEIRIELDVSSSISFRRRDNTTSILSLISQDIVNIDSTSNSNMSKKKNFQNFDFNRQQYETLQVFLVDVKNHAQFESQEVSKFVESFDSFDDFETNRWNSNEIEFFDSMYDDKFSIIDNSIEHANKNTYFRDVHLFTERIKNMIIVKKAKLTRQNLYICLRDLVLTWYIDVFNDDQKRLMKLDDEIEKWERTLLKRWKKSSITIMTMIIKERYIMKNVRKHRKFFEFAQIIIRKTKSTLMFVFFQIYLIYNDLKLKFKRDLNKSNESITMNFFLQKLKNNKKIWWNLDNRHRYTNQLFDSNRVQNNYRSSKQVDNYINFFSFDVRQDNDDYNFVEFISTTNVISQRQTQYFIFYQFERQNTVYRSSQY